MASPFDKAHLTQLKQFITLCQASPSILHHPDLDFFKEYLESLGATIPPKPVNDPSGDHPASSPESEKPKAEPEHHEATSADMTEEVEEEEVESEVELDETLKVEPDEEEPQQMGDETIEVTDEMLEESSDKRAQAQEALSEGKFDEALALFTEAIMKNPQSAALYAKRASVYIKMKKPNAAVRDCDKALELNPDSALAYKFRGRARSFLGLWEEAATDLATACRIDYTDEANEWLKEVMPNAKKLQEHRRKYERIHQEKEMKEKMERIRKAQEEREKAAKNASSSSGFSFPGGMPNMGPAGLGKLQDLLNDPDFIQAMQDPEVSSAFEDIMGNPSNIVKYQGNPKVMALVTKLAEKMGAAGKMPFHSF